MSIVGDTLETGLRVDVSRPREGGPPWRYEGEAMIPGTRFPLTAVIAIDGHVSVELPPGAPAALAERVRLLLRAAYKHAHEDTRFPPRRIVRWRSDGRSDGRSDCDVAPPRRGE